VTSAVTTSFDPLAAMRSRSALAPKPANTAEWMAPMRAQASMVTIASGQVGM
jgi:hypothetical protein